MDQRDEAPKFDLSAQPADAEDALLLNPADLNAPSSDKPEAARPRVKKNKLSKTSQAGLDAKLFEALVGPAAPVSLNKGAASARPALTPPFDITDEPLMVTDRAPSHVRSAKFTVEPVVAAPVVVEPVVAEPVVEDEAPIPVEVYDEPEPVAVPTPEAVTPDHGAAPTSQGESEAPFSERHAADLEADAAIPPTFIMFPLPPVGLPPAEADWEPLPLISSSPTMRYVPAEYDEPADEQPGTAYTPVMVPVENTQHGLITPASDAPIPSAMIDAEPENLAPETELAPVITPEPFEIVGLPPMMESPVSETVVPLPFDLAAAPAATSVRPSPVRRVYDPAAIEDESPAATGDAAEDIEQTVFAPEPEATAADDGIDDGADQDVADQDEEAEDDQWPDPVDQERQLVGAGAIGVKEPRGRTGAWWTIPLLCAGLAIVACAVLVPAADENRRATHELAKIDRDVGYFQKQSEVNKEFIERVATDPTLAERLAMRQLRLTRANSRVVQMHAKGDAFSMSPYALVSVDPPPALPEYRSVTGFISKYFLDTRGQIYLAGLGVLMAAAGVILGGGTSPRRPAPL